jgi:SAM-dependent methyltransferase
MKIYKNYKNIKLNLGSGNKKIPGFVNLDIRPLLNVDIVWDLNKGIPLTDNTVEEILANDIIEHIPDTIRLFKELYRVCKPGAIIKIKVPYCQSTAAFQDPTHKSFFTEETFCYFNPKEREKRNLPNYCPEVNFEIVKIDYWYTFRGARFLPEFFKSFLRKYFWNIARKMYVELRVIK